MAPRIFITGITGYIGGDAFAHISQVHPEYLFVALVRTQEKARTVQQRCPDVEVVIGDLDDYDIIKREAEKADIVIHTADASDHEGAAKAIAEGLASGHSADKPGFWLHTGGTGILTYEDSKNDRLGEASDKVYDDWDKVDELTGLPDEAFHRNVDKIVLEAGTKNAASVKTALLCPPTIYGKGRGPSASRGRQVYELAKVILTDKYVPVVGEGRARWNQVHVADLADAFLLLVEAAVSKKVDDRLWGSEGYYIIENGEFVWGDLAKQMGSKAADLGYISAPESKQLSKDAAMDQAGFEAVSWGLNSRARAIRARKLLDWTPTRPSLEEEIPNILKEEKDRLSPS